MHTTILDNTDNFIWFCWAILFLTPSWKPGLILCSHWVAQAWILQAFPLPCFLSISLPKLIQLRRNKEAKKSRVWFIFSPLSTIWCCCGITNLGSSSFFFINIMWWPALKPCDHSLYLKKPHLHTRDEVPSSCKITPGVCIRVTSPSNTQL